MRKGTPKEEPRKDAPTRKGGESSKAQSVAQPVENKVRVEDLLDFSFVEVAVDRRVALAELRRARRAALPQRDRLCAGTRSPLCPRTSYRRRLLRL